MDLNSLKKRTNEGPTPLSLLPIRTLENIETLLSDVIENNIAGDFVETGVWKGGACILAYHVIKNLNSDKKVWAFDSFEGLPKPNPDKYPVDAGDGHWTIDSLRVSVDSVKENFRIFGEIEVDNPIFVKGWFKDTMPVNTVKDISVLRLDGDMYESTIDVLNYLYPKLSVGGYCIIDDFGHKGAKAAVLDYRKQYLIEDEIRKIDDTPGVHPSVYWKKTK